MLFTTFSILLLALVFAGAGLLVPWASFHRRPSFAALLNAFWTGWALTLALLQVWHLFYRVSDLALGVVFGLGLAGWASARKALLAWLRSLPRAAIAAVAAFAAASAMVLAVHVFFLSPHFDHGLYHMPTVGWLGDYAIVPGLGNLHHRLAFNNANFLYAALVNSGFLAGRGYWVANTLLGFAVIMQCGDGFYRQFGSAGQTSPRSSAVEPLYWSLMLPGVLWHLSTTHLPGYSPDVVVFALQAVVGGTLLGLFDEHDREAAAARAAYIVLLAAAGVTVKLSFAVFALLAILAVLVFWWFRFRPRTRADFRPIAGWAALALALVIPWLGRGVLLSGYPLFPSTALGMPVPWRMPEALVSPISPIILNWARTVNSTIPYTGDLAWMRAWYEAFPYEVVKRAFMLAAAGGAAGLLLLAYLRVRSPRGSIAAGWDAIALFAVSAGGLAAWFLMAPDYRFSGALVWMLLASALCLGWRLLADAGIARESLRLAAVLVVGLALFVSPNHFELHKPGDQVLLPQTEPEWVQQFAPDKPSETRVTRSGLTVYMPAASEQQCFDLPEPCTRPQDYLDTLRLFEPGNLQRGFYIDSPDD